MPQGFGRQARTMKMVLGLGSYAMRYAIFYINIRVTDTRHACLPVGRDTVTLFSK